MPVEVEYVLTVIDAYLQYKGVNVDTHEAELKALIEAENLHI